MCLLTCVKASQGEGKQLHAVLCPLTTREKALKGSHITPACAPQQQGITHGASMHAHTPHQQSLPNCSLPAPKAHAHALTSSFPHALHWGHAPPAQCCPLWQTASRAALCGRLAGALAHQGHQVSMYAMLRAAWTPAAIKGERSTGMGHCNLSGLAGMLIVEAWLVCGLLVWWYDVLRL